MAAQITQVIPTYSGVVPNRGQSPEDFRDNADAWLAYQAPLAPDYNSFATQANALSDFVESEAINAEQSAISADASEAQALIYRDQAAGTANFKGLWSAATGAATVPASYAHNGFIWALNVPLANIALSEPSFTNTAWTVVSSVTGQINLFKELRKRTTLIADYDQNQHFIYEKYGLTPKSITDYTTVTRGSTATYIDALGVLRTAAANELRIQYDPITGACLGALIEPSATNLWTYSTDLSNAAWTKTDTTLGTPVAIRGYTLDLLTQGAAGTAAVSRAATTTTSGGLHTASKVVTKGSHDWLCLSFGDTLGNSVSTWFNYSTGLFGTLAQSGSPTNIIRLAVPLGDGLYLLAFTASLAGTSVNFKTYGTTADNVTTRVSGGTRYEGEAQLEIGSVATSRIRTVASQVTRAADVPVISGAEFAKFYNPTEGTIYVEFVMPAVALSTIFQLQLDVNNWILLLRDSTLSQVRVASVVGGVTSGFINSQTISTGTIVKAAIKLTPGFISVSFNGSAVQQVASTILLTYTQFNVGFGVSASQLRSTIAKIRYINRAITDAEAQFITTYGMD